MAITKTTALILRRIYFSNTSMILTMISRDQGLLTLIAKGCRRPKSNMFGKLDFFNLGETVFYRKNNESMHILSQFDPEHEPIALRSNITRYAAAAYMAEQVIYSCESGESMPDIFELINKALVSLEADCAPLTVATAFGLELLACHGMTPLLDTCCRCGAPLTKGVVMLSDEKGGIECPTHGGRTKIEPPVLSALKFLQRTGLNQAASRIKTRANIEKPALAAAHHLLSTQLGLRNDSVSYLLRTVSRSKERHVA